MTTQQNMTHPWILRWQPRSLAQLRFTVDESLNLGYPIDRKFDLPCMPVKGQSVSDQQAMRQGVVKRTDEHVAALVSRYPDEQVISFVGNGNLLANYDFVAWQVGQLYRLAYKPAYKQAYTCIVTWCDGSISVETLWFAREDNCTIILTRCHLGPQILCPHLLHDQTLALEFIKRARKPDDTAKTQRKLQAPA